VAAGGPAGPAAAAVALLLVVAWTPLGPALLGTCVRRDLPPAPAAVDVPRDVDAVAVLSADVQSDGLVANRGVDRLLAGAAWSRVLRRPLVLSVIRLRAGDVSSEADQRRVAALAGIGAADLFFVDSVHVTRDEAVRAAALARVRGWRRVLVVTSPSHSRRACAAFERAGLRVTCAPAESRDYALAGPRPVAGRGSGCGRSATGCTRHSAGGATGRGGGCERLGRRPPRRAAGPA
jgi:uncharacterized SAM-binding protein YcdF (DUF218 family)